MAKLYHLGYYSLHISILSIVLVLFFSACSVKIEATKLSEKPLYLSENEIVLLDYISLKEMQKVQKIFEMSCEKKRFSSKYASTCKELRHYKNARDFFTNAFSLQKIVANESENLMTGYYEATLKGSRVKTPTYQYPIYAVPKDFKQPFLERKVINNGGINAKVLCYVDNQLDRFFLHVQGSGRVMFEDGTSMFVGYAAQNGHKYTSIGKEMIKRGYIAKEAISLQSIKHYFDIHPNKLKEILEINKSYVFFARTRQSATGALGVELTPMHSVATDLSYIPLGTPLLYKANNMMHLALSQDTGGAIKGEVRADLFFGFGDEAKQKAGKMNHNLDLWVLVPKVKKSQQP